MTKRKKPICVIILICVICGLLFLSSIAYALEMDLHSNNTCCLITDEADRWVLKRKLKNDMPTILTNLKPYKESIEGIAVEATYNWYWIVDGLMRADYKINLAHPLIAIPTQ